MAALPVIAEAIAFVTAISALAMMAANTTHFLPVFGFKLNESRKRIILYCKKKLPVALYPCQLTIKYRGNHNFNFFDHVYYFNYSFYKIEYIEYIFLF